MAYEQDSQYLEVFDPRQSPAWQDALAHRLGGDSAPGPERNTTITYIDLGCAAGLTLLALAPMYPWMRFIGVDFNPRHIHAATAEARRLALENVEFHCADFRNLPPQLPPADYLNVRGVYSWLAPEVRTDLEQALARLSRPGTLLKLHYSVLPGSSARDALGQFVTCATSPAAQPLSQLKAARAALQALADFKPGFPHKLPMPRDGLQEWLQAPDALWLHDFLNPDFRSEYARDVIHRLARIGFSYLGAASMETNLYPHMLSEALRQRLPADPAQAQTLLDVLSGAPFRDDLFIFGGADRAVARPYTPDTRFGVVVADARLMQAQSTPFGEIQQNHPQVRALLGLLGERPLSVGQLSHAVGSEMSLDALCDRLDWLLAARKIAPFAPQARVAQVDRQRLAQINRERLDQALETLGPHTQTPLLAAEYGNCLVAGWFECLVLAHLEKRHHVPTQRSMLARMHASRMAFRAPDGQPASDQLKAFQAALERLEVNYLSKMAYWGIDI